MTEAKDVYELVGFNATALIVRAPTGMVFSAQTGGIACYHPECEGFVIALPEYATDVDDCTLGCWGCQSEKHVELADLIDAYFIEHPHPFRFMIDRNRVGELMEGWWPVKFTLLGEVRNGYIHTGNCD